MADALDLTCINTIRTLAMDAVQKANSGHPGAPMGLAPVAYTLWNKFLKYDPADPLWPNRDRFVLSNGHASMLLYSLIHLAGVRNVDENGKVLDEPSLPRGRRRDHDRPARAGARQRRRHGHRPEVAGRPLRPPRVRGPLRPPHLRDLWRRVHDGGRGQ